MHVGILSQINRREVEAEYVDRPLQRPQAPARQDRRAVALQRPGDRVEIGRQLFDARVSRRVSQRMTQGDDVIEVARRLGEARIHAGDGAPIGLVLPLRRGVVGAVGERVQFLADPHELGGQRQLAAELMQLVEIVAERAGALQSRGLVKHARGHIGIAVAVAANPRADAQEGRDPLPGRARALLGERVRDDAVEPRQFTEERVIVIGEAIGHLVDYGQAGLTQHVGAPQDENGPAQPLFVERQRRLVAVGALAGVEQFGDFQLAGQRALAPDLGRMGGQHRAHQRALEEGAERSRLDAHLARALKRVGQRAGARRGARDHMRAVAADVMLVLGDVGQMREIAVCAHDRERLVGAEAVEGGLQLAPRADLVIAMEADRGLADLLHQGEDLLALLLAHGVAQDAAEQADVAAQRTILLGVFRVMRRSDGRRSGETHRANPSSAEPTGNDVALRQAPAQVRKASNNAKG